jgi:hypothetical protein
VISFCHYKTSTCTHTGICFLILEFQEIKHRTSGTSTRSDLCLEHSCGQALISSQHQAVSAPGTMVDLEVRKMEAFANAPRALPGMENRYDNTANSKPQGHNEPAEGVACQNLSARMGNQMEHHAHFRCAILIKLHVPQTRYPWAGEFTPKW